MRIRGKVNFAVARLIIEKGITRLQGFFFINLKNQPNIQR